MNPFKSTDSVTLLLFYGIWLAVIVLVVGEIFFQNDSQLFQVVAGLLTGFLGAFLGRVKPETAPPGTTTATTTVQVTETPTKEPSGS